jgi:hypothetical protein
MIEMGMTWKGVPLTRASEALRNEYSMHHMWRFVRFSDYGAAAYMTYTTDLCRTWPVSGRFTAEQRKYYDIVLEAQEAAIGAIRRGVAMLDVIKASARVFERHGLTRYEDGARARGRSLGAGNFYYSIYAFLADFLRCEHNACRHLAACPARPGVRS